MTGSVKLALGILIAWVAGTLLFSAFHPRGIQMDDGSPAAGPTDVLKYLISKRTILGDLGKDTTGGNSTPSSGSGETNPGNGQGNQPRPA